MEGLTDTIPSRVASLALHAPHAAREACRVALHSAGKPYGMQN